MFLALISESEINTHHNGMSHRNYRIRDHHGGLRDRRILDRRFCRLGCIGQSIRRCVFRLSLIKSASIKNQRTRVHLACHDRHDLVLESAIYLGNLLYRRGRNRARHGILLSLVGRHDLV